MQHGTRPAKKCQQCGKGNRSWRCCALCGAGPCACLFVDGEWRCGRCARLAALCSGALPACGTRIVPTWTDAEAHALHALHLGPSVRVWVDVWIVPLSAECVLILARFIIWRRHGYLCGLLCGVPALEWSHARHVFDLEGLTARLAEWWQGGTWPPGSAPILLLQLEARFVAEVRGHAALAHLPPAQLSRLRQGPGLSECGANAGFDVAAFAKKPASAKWRTVAIVRHCRNAVHMAGLDDGTVTALEEPGDRGDAFRGGLYPPRS